MRLARTLQRHRISHQCDSKTYFSEGGTVNDFISGVEDRFHFFDTFVVPHEDEAKSSVCRPRLLHSVVGQKVRQLLERRHRQILHHDELLDAVPPLHIRGGGDAQPLVLKDGQPELAVSQLDDDRRRPHHSISERGFTNPEQVFNDIVDNRNRRGVTFCFSCHQNWLENPIVDPRSQSPA